MANNAQSKAVKPSFGTRFVNFFKGIPPKFKNMVAELKKVVWPTKKELINYSIVVIVFMVIMGIVIGLVDAGSGLLLQLITG